MRKLLCCLLSILLLCPFFASAAEGPEYAALIFPGLPAGSDGKLLLEGLEARNAHATFFLWAGPWEQGQRVLQGGHEIGLLTPDSLNRMSRRKVASRLRGAQALLPPCRIRCLMSQGHCSDGLRQVAGVLNLSFPEFSAGEFPLPDRIKSGDILFLPASTEADVRKALALVDQLRDRGFVLVSASELARLNRAGII
jgi:hypothetical protein